MICTVDQMLKTCADQIGYCEKKSNANLDSKTANAGSANFSKFGRDVSIPKYWNGNKNGFDWCTSFITACLIYSCGGTPNGGSANEKYFADVKKIQPYTSLGASCKYQTNAYKNAGKWSSTPKVGYQAFFTRGHTGIVEKVGASSITLIEGNSNNRVERRTYKFPNNIFAGFGIPSYGKAQEKPKEEPKPSTPSSSTTTPSFVQYNGKVTPSNGLNVRTGAGTSYKKIGALKCGTTVTIKEEKNGWGRIAYNGQSGWICLSYVKKV